MRLLNLTHMPLYFHNTSSTERGFQTVSATRTSAIQRQSYIWMVHKVPGSEKWELAMRSRQLWEKFAKDIKHQGMDPQEVLGWKKTGSLLVGKTSQDMAELKGKVDRLSKAGLKAELLSTIDLLQVEPALLIGEEGGAAFLPDDYQLDARRSVAYIEKENRKYVTEGRYWE